jgi:shikimate kinase
VARLGRSIVDLFEAGEEGLFRATEADVTARVVAERPPRVVALGGGALEDPTTRRLVADRSLLVLLEQSWADIALALPTLRRGRPLLASRSDDEIRELFERRQSNYAAAQLRVPVDRRGIDGAVAAVLRALSTISQRQIPPSPTDGPIPDSFGP